MKTTARLPQKWGPRLAFALALVVLLSGCGLLREVSNVPTQVARAVTPGSKSGSIPNPVDVQQRLLRFADEFSARIMVGLDGLRYRTNEIPPAEVVRWKIALVDETCSIATGPNAIVNLLDMTVFVTVARMAVEDYWLPEVFGPSAQPMLDSFRTAESNIWAQTGLVLSVPQSAELRQAVETWHRQNPHPKSVLTVRAVGFSTQLAELYKSNQTKSGSVFSLLNVDPFAGLDPTTREIAETRLFAERAFYYTTKMPTLLRWQTELLSYNTLALPPVQQMVTNATELTASIQNLSRVAGQLPLQVSTEREKIVEALQSQEKNLATLAGQVRQTLDAGAQMSASLNTTLITYDALMKRFGVGETNATSAPDTNSPPFRILDYAQTATQLEGAARQLTELLRVLDQTASPTNLARFQAQITPVVQQAQTSGKELVDYAFWKGLLFVVLVFVVALIYRFLVARMTARNSK